MQSNYWDEWEDAYRAVKCKTKPIMVTDKFGAQSEDTTRTNVCMPELSLIRRRKTARLTANPPQINYLTENGDNDPVAQKLTALAYQQWDRSKETLEHRRIVDSGITFGVGYGKVFWDTIEIMRRVRAPLLPGNSEGDEDGGNRQPGYSTQIDEDRIKQLIAASSDEQQDRQRTIRYEGPVTKNVFVGDLFLEPGAKNLAESGYVVESYWETDVWLQKMVRKTYIDPETGEEQKLFDIGKAQELVDMPTPNVANTSQQPFDLRTRLRTASLNQTIPTHPSRLIPGKRFDILESHQRDEYGQMWITWVGNEKVLLGKMPYPWDLYGQTVYSEFVPLPDILNSIGDSTPRLFRWLHFLHNSTVGQRKDLVNAILRPLMGMRQGADIPDEALERKLMRIIQMKAPGDLWPIQEGAAIGQAISAGMEEEGQILRMMALAEPSLNTTDTGSSANPQAGKLATTAILNAKAADALTQFELDGLNLYLKDSCEKKLWMNQQMMQDAMDEQGNQQFTPDGQPFSTKLGPQYTAKVQGLSERMGKSGGLYLDWREIQGDIQVEPAAGSMLAVDDEIKRSAAQEFYMMAHQDPINFNVNYAAQNYASTIRGVDVSKAVNPPAPPQPPPPKVNVAIAVKWGELPAEVQAAILQGNGVQIDDTIMSDLSQQHELSDVQRVSAASDAASNILSPPDHEQPMIQKAHEAELQLKQNAQQSELSKDQATHAAKVAPKPNGKSKPN
jgi:hypothetical protein